MSITILGNDPFEEQVASRAHQASPKQLAFIDRLLAERDLSDARPWVGPFVDHYRDGATIDRRQASSLIDVLLEAPRLTTHAAPPSARATTEPLAPGMYMVGDRIFKLQQSQTGHLYGKELVDGRFTYAPGLLREVHADDRMTLEQAKAYGQNTGVCCCCGRLLTDPSSVAAGIGPVCASRV